MTNRGKRKDQRERGQMLIAAALVMAVVMGLTAMAVDAGMLFHDRRNLQNSADAAALAGAAYLPANPTTAVQEARTWAHKNGISDSQILTIAVQQTYVPNDTMYVQLQDNFHWIFGRVLGLVSTNIGGTAKARIGSPAGMAKFIPLSALQSQVSGLKSGDTLTLKYNQQTQTSGNSLALAFPGSSGGSDFKYNIENGSSETFCVYGQEYPGCTSSISTETGHMEGPTDQAIKYMLQNTSSSCSTYSQVFTPDPNNPGSMLINPACNPFPPDNVTNSMRVVLVPIIDSLCNGSCTVHIVQFAMMFINSYSCNQGQGSCQVVGQFVQASLDPTTLVLGAYNSGSALKFVRLVQ